MQQCAGRFIYVEQRRRVNDYVVVVLERVDFAEKAGPACPKFAGLMACEAQSHAAASIFYILFPQIKSIMEIRIVDISPS